MSCLLLGRSMVCAATILHSGITRQTASHQNDTPNSHGKTIAKLRMTLLYIVDDSIARCGISGVPVRSLPIHLQ